MIELSVSTIIIISLIALIIGIIVGVSLGRPNYR